MNTRWRWVVAAAGLVAYIVAFALAPEVDPLARGRWHFTREDTVERCRRAAGRLGFDVGGWQTAVVVRYNEKRAWWLRHRPGGRGSPLISPLEAQTTFLRPGQPESISIRISAAGRITGFSHHIAGDRLKERSQPTDFEAARARAEQAFQLFMGDRAERFEQVTAGARQQDRVRYVWSDRRPVSPDVRWTVRVDVQQGRVLDAAGEESYSDSFNGAYRNYSLFFGSGGVLVGILGLATAILAGMLFLLSAMRRSVNWRFTLTAAGIVVLLKVLAFPGSPSVESSLSQPRPSEPFSFVFGWLFAAVFALCLAGAGEAAARRNDSSRWLTFRLLLAGHAGVARVGAEAAMGMLGGGLLACASLLVGPLFPDLSALPGIPPTALVVPYPSLAFLDGIPQWPVFAYFAFVLPWLGGSLAISWPRRLLAAGAGLAAMLAMAPYGGPLTAILACAVVVLALGLFLYEQFGLVAVLSAFAAAWLFRHAVILVNAGDASLVAAGWVDFAILMAVLAAASVVRVHGREISPTEAETVSGAASVDTYLTPRERMKVEIALARKAQERMLPHETPGIEGFSVSALCLPARELGGDLFDFLRLADGRTALCVADVSGKGVPAALYMTLTKGLLAASSEECSDVGEIARRLNASLYESSERNVFVTAALGVVFPEDRTFQFVRAGHNPLMWHSAASGETRLLAPQGLGLGFAPSRIFDQALEIETIRLQPGDTLLLYSDGLTEAMNRHQEQFGEERLMKALAASHRGSVEHIRERILVDMSAFRGDAPAHDDITLVILKVEPNGRPS
jgi:phosphoserine phosphatase RsbU/P